MGTKSEILCEPVSARAYHSTDQRIETRLPLVKVPERETPWLANLLVTLTDGSAWVT